MFDHVSIGVSDIKRRVRSMTRPEAARYTRLSDARARWVTAKRRGLWLLAAKKPVKADTESGLHFCFVARIAPRSTPFMRRPSNWRQGQRQAGVRPIQREILRRFVVDPTVSNRAYCGK